MGVYCDVYDSPVGLLLLRSDGLALTGLSMISEPPESINPHPIFSKIKRWLDDYFRGTDRPVDFSVALEGTAFQKLIWQLLVDIPWGAVRAYGDLAKDAARILGKERMSAQAVGQAVGANPVAVIIPCHRCVAAGGKLGGYAYGAQKKQWLIDHERKNWHEICEDSGTHHAAADSAEAADGGYL